ncbi:hypothetical protein K431DRAFT_314484 [Polychaeton citri CBS 116435]|uniref:Uncharacterized protein n=1 Tax=Polychaeton citri CBS 116435 TaxID=1314669 RepID=A0A9P4Q5Z8_9PEZI|nr:hypothetical protein K431DRAFT_314484 [Polychaeton citri CBS 116435]
MGGDAFAQAVSQSEDHPTLHTPRMDPATYTSLRDTYTQKLVSCLPSARVLPYKEAPEKTDYGDIDYLVATSDAVNFSELAQHIGAAAYLPRGTNTASFAVRHDGHVGSEPTRYTQIASDRPNARQPSKTVTLELYAQVDLAVASLDEADWRMFMASYSDLSGIIGNIIRNVGFTLNHSGLYLRLRELDEAKPKNYINVSDSDGMVLLTDDVSMALSFLGLDVSSYDAGFDTLADMYAWVAGCKYLYPEAIFKKRDTCRDRQKARSRPVFTGFFDEWLPSNKPAFAPVRRASSDATLAPSTGNVEEDTLSAYRLEALQESLDCFSKQQDYTTKHSTLIRTVSNATAAYLLKPMIGAASGRQGTSLTEILRAFRRWVGIDENGKLVVSEKRHMDKEALLYSVLDESGEAIREREVVEAWIAEHWEEIRRKERMTAKEGSA